MQRYIERAQDEQRRLEFCTNLKVYHKKKKKKNIVGHYIYYIYKSNNFGQFSKNAFISHTVVKLKASANLHKILDI